MAKVRVQLLSHANRGRAPSTRWGRIAFDENGHAELEVEEEDLPTLRSLSWLVEEAAPPEAIPPVSGSAYSPTEPPPSPVEPPLPVERGRTTLPLPASGPSPAPSRGRVTMPPPSMKKN